MGKRAKNNLSATRRQPPPKEMEALATLFVKGEYRAAEKLARAMTLQFPRHEFGWKVLGAVLSALGLSSEALAAKRRAVEFAPDDAEAHSNLCNSLLATNQLEEAEYHGRRAIILKPDWAVAHNNLSLVLLRQGKRGEAEVCARQALALDPKYPEAMNSLGLALVEAGHYAAAIECFEASLVLRPHYSKAHMNLGDVYVIQGFAEAAETAYRLSLDITPASHETWFALANLAFDQGDFGRVQEHLQQVFKYAPDMPEAWALLARLRKMAPADRPWLEQANVLLSRPLGVRAEAELCCAMGKFCDDVQDYPQAFAYYQRAGALKQKFSEAYDSSRQERLVGRICQSHTATVVRHPYAGASDSVRPLFIVGMPRSGTSLIEQILASHPAIFGCGELLFWGEQAALLQEAYLDARYGEIALEGLASGALNNLEKRAGPEALRVVDKMPGNFQFLGLIHAVFPNARILHTMRHPIDTCLSIYFQSYREAYANDLGNLAHYYRQYHRLMEHWRKVLPADVFLDVPYESLVENPESWSRKIIAFLGLEWDARCLDFHKTERKVATASNWQVKQPVYKTSKERWRNYEQFVAPLLPLLNLK